MKIFTQSVYILCRDREKFVQHIFFVLKIVQLLLKESVQLIFLFLSKCVAASGNISIFFKERGAASGKILTTASERKMCSCFLELCPLKKYFEVKNRLK